MSETTVGKMKQGLLRRLASIAVGLLVASGAQAVSISPVLVELTPTHRVAAITVNNESDLPLILQTETLAWTQPNGEDLNQETEDLLVVPPIAEIKPGGSQIFRVTLRQPTPAAVERAYRLVLDDVSEIKKETKGIGVTFSFSHRLPVFVVGTGKIGPKPRLGACSPDSSSGCVRLDNEGDRFVHVRRLTVEGGDWHKEMGGGTRVLAGAWKQWTFAWPTKHAGSLTVNAETSAGPLTTELPPPGR